MTEVVTISVDQFNNIIDEKLNSIIDKVADEIDRRNPKPVKMYSTTQTCALLGISESTFRRYVKEGTLKAKKIGGHIKITEDEINHIKQDVKSLKYRRT